MKTKHIEMWGAAWCSQCPGAWQELGKFTKAHKGWTAIKYDFDNPDEPKPPESVRSLPYIQIYDETGVCVYQGNAVHKNSLESFLGLTDD